MFAAVPLLLGLGQTFVIIAGGIDLSVGFVMGLAAVIMARVMQMLTGLPPGLALAAGLGAAFLVSLVPGTINGLLIARLRVPAFIGTLGMYGVARGAGFLAADGTTVPVNNPWLFEMGNARLLGVPLPVVITIAVVLALHYVLSQTRFGQYTYAIGGNRMAALRSGINVRRHTMTIYLISAGCAGIAGMIYTARFSAGAAQAGEPLLLDSIAAVVIGGASLFGGSGTIIGTVIGALIIAVIQYGLVFIDVEPFWQFVAVGVVIIVSVLVDQSRSRLKGEIKDEL
jgi:ribose transport system permease protein